MDFMPDSPLWLIYLGVAIGPFVQEDAAVFTAGTLSANGMYNSTTLFIVILLGLIASDAWKYWIGRVALKNPRAKAYAEKQHVTDFKDKVKRHLGVTLLTVRFVPLARVPTYVACGFFHVSYLRYLFWISISALLYVIAVFLMCHLLGALLGDMFHWVFPITAITLFLLYITYRYWRRNKEEEANG